MRFVSREEKRKLFQRQRRPRTERRLHDLKTDFPIRRLRMLCLLPSLLFCLPLLLLRCPTWATVRKPGGFSFASAQPQIYGGMVAMQTNQPTIQPKNKQTKKQTTKSYERINPHSTRLSSGNCRLNCTLHHLFIPVSATSM